MSIRVPSWEFCRTNWTNGHTPLAIAAIIQLGDQVFNILRQQFIQRVQDAFHRLRVAFFLLCEQMAVLVNQRLLSYSICTFCKIQRFRGPVVIHFD